MEEENKSGKKGGKGGRAGRKIRECGRGEAEVAGGAKGRVNSAPTRRFGHSEPGTQGSTPPFLPLHSP